MIRRIRADGMTEVYTSVSKVCYSSIAQSVEHAAVNRGVVGSSPTWGVSERKEKMKNGSLVKRLRHRPFTAVTRVRFP